MRPKMSADWNRIIRTSIISEKNKKLTQQRVVHDPRVFFCCCCFCFPAHRNNRGNKKHEPNFIHKMASNGGDIICSRRSLDFFFFLNSHSFSRKEVCTTKMATQSNMSRVQICVTYFFFFKVGILNKKKKKRCCIPE